jgi:hypothetical protein
LAATGQRSEALTRLQRVLDIRRARGETANAVAQAAFELARVLAGPGARTADRARARELAREARSLWQQDGISDKLHSVDQWLEAASPSATSPRPHVANE